MFLKITYVYKDRTNYKVHFQPADDGTVLLFSDYGEYLGNARTVDSLIMHFKVLGAI